MYYQNYLPTMFIPELTDPDESLIMEVGRKKCILTSIYRSPAIENNSPESINDFIN